MKAIILARVSTEEQITEGQSIPAQLEKARAYASRKELKIKSEYQFDESSVKDRRTKFEQVISEIKNATEKIALIVETVDRLQRSFKESVLLDEFRKQDKLEIHFIRENLVIHKNSNSSEIQRWDLAVFVAKSYVLQVSDNVKRTIDHKLKNGEFPGPAPYGYTNIKNEDGKAWIAPDPFKSQIVTKIYEWYGSEAYSMEQIRFKLKDEYSLELSKGTIDYILKNPFYCGDRIYRKKLLHGHIYQTIVSRQLFDKVQSIKAGYHKKPFKFAGLPYLYRGLLTCEKCGHAFTPEKKRKKSGREYIYYHCTEYSGKHGTAWLTEDEITRQFTEIVKGISVPVPIRKEISEILEESHKGKVEYHDALFKGLQAEYTKYQTRIENLYDLYADRRITDNDYDKKSNEYREKQEEIQSRLSTLQSADEDFYLTAKYILSLVNNAGKIFESSEPEVKRQLLKVLLQNCEVNATTLYPTYRSPFHMFAEGASRQVWLPASH